MATTPVGASVAGVAPTVPAPPHAVTRIVKSQAIEGIGERERICLMVPDPWLES
jgi:hypothetical protein